MSAMRSVARPVVVIGDALLDVDVEGTVDRLCPDAPVPVHTVIASMRPLEETNSPIATPLGTAVYGEAREKGRRRYSAW